MRRGGDPDAAYEERVIEHHDLEQLLTVEELAGVDLLDSACERLLAWEIAPRLIGEQEPYDTSGARVLLNDLRESIVAGAHARRQEAA